MPLRWQVLNWVAFTEARLGPKNRNFVNNELFPSAAAAPFCAFLLISVTFFFLFMPDFVVLKRNEIFLFCFGLW